jgi:DNA-binding CsgD family transcriptional regulator
MKTNILELSTGQSVPPSPVARQLRKIAEKKAASLIWNTPTMLMFYALMVVVALLRLEGVDIILVMVVASVGLLTLWIVSRLRWKKLERRLYEEELRSFQRMVASGRRDPLEAEPKRTADSPLSNRELEVLARIAEGMINKQIAVSLGISSQTVKNHVSHILAKLDVGDRTAAVLMAVSNGWVKITVTGTDIGRTNIDS